jgi:hypothetical protein
MYNMKDFFFYTIKVWKHHNEYCSNMSHLLFEVDLFDTDCHSCWTIDIAQNCYMYVRIILFEVITLEIVTQRYYFFLSLFMIEIDDIDEYWWWLIFDDRVIHGNQ